MYEFADARIAQAIIIAHQRGVQCNVILDPSNSRLHDGCEPMLIASGVPTWIDNAHAIMHSKTLIIDEKLVITGSYNYTIAAEFRNAETAIQLIDPSTAALFVLDFQRHLSHSVAAK